MAAARLRGRRCQPMEGQAEDSKPEVAGRPSHSGARSKVHQLIGLVRPGLRTSSREIRLKASCEKCKYFFGGTAKKSKKVTPPAQTRRGEPGHQTVHCPGWPSVRRTSVFGTPLLTERRKASGMTSLTSHSLP